MKNALSIISEKHNNFLEVFLNYTKSMALWSVICFVIGIGDRHLWNILLNTDTGEIVHIDFDMIFKKSVSLPVPEIMDFRLTNNFQQALGITKQYGLFFVFFEDFLKILKEE